MEPPTYHRRRCKVYAWKPRDYRSPHLSQQIAERATDKSRETLHGKAFLEHVAACGHFDRVMEAEINWRFCYADPDEIDLVEANLGDYGRTLLGGMS